MYAAATELLMHPLDIGLVLLGLALTYAIWAWSRVRMREIEVKLDKLRFGREQLQFAQQQYNDMAQIRAEQIKALGNIPVPGALPFVPPRGGSNNIQ